MRQVQLEKLRQEQTEYFLNLRLSHPQLTYLLVELSVLREDARLELFIQRLDVVVPVSSGAPDVEGSLLLKFSIYGLNRLRVVELLLPLVHGRLQLVDPLHFVFDVLGFEQQHLLLRVG